MVRIHKVEPARWRWQAAVLASGTFAVGTDAFVISGVLPEIANSLRISVAEAGQLVTVFSFTYAVAALVLGALTASWARRTVLTIALIVFAAGNILTAIAPGYGLVLASRVIAAAGAAMYTASASATAATLAGERHRGRAIAIVLFGLTASLVLGAPLGTLIGSALGWRATLWFVAALSVVALPVIAYRLPRVDVESVVGLRRRLMPLADRRILVILARTFIVFTGIYLPYTYLSAVYNPAIRGSGGRLAALLLVFGLAGTVGNLAAGHLADRFGSRRVVLGTTLALTVVFLAVPVLCGSIAPATAVVLISGLLSFSVNAPQQHEIIALAPEARPVVTSLYQAVLYLAVSLSGAVGAIGLHFADGPYLAPLAAIFVGLAALLTWRSGRHTSIVSTALPRSRIEA